ncbi:MULTISPECIES: 2-keto-4-pentenoate hydratase [unclassified Thioalkalivibrio]|uniref:2-keto-4-pentenoate hydratase n=1 Tax=unclassified Thioalkalivibrio TaxID=2621013 RepID=UPI00047828A3|nr:MULTISPECIES: fumarylacetoacetate hydrolase [unclassified Thioalkalivibrio]
MADALCIQRAMVTELDVVVGPHVGWKVGLTSETVQERFGADAPVAGPMLAGMIWPSELPVARDFGARPMVEADLAVRVADPAIMQASDHAEVLAAIDWVLPFIELVDLMVADPATLDARSITAINVGARGGVLGEPVPVTPEMAETLAAMTVVIENEDGEVLGEYPGSAILGHPLDAVLWLVDELAARGESLEAGELLSLGSFGPLFAVDEHDAFRVRYEGLVPDHVPEVEVRFE